MKIELYKPALMHRNRFEIEEEVFTFRDELETNEHYKSRKAECLKVRFLTFDLTIQFRKFPRNYFQPLNKSNIKVPILEPEFVRVY